MSASASTPTRRGLLATSAAAATAAFALRVVPGFAHTRSNGAEFGDPLEEGQAAVTTLGANSSALTYWVSRPDGWHVVTTVDSVIDQGGNAEQHVIVRFSGLLQPGQSQLISVPAAIGEPQQALRIVRRGNRIEIARAANAA
jgi:hypothetical protein